MAGVGDMDGQMRRRQVSTFRSEVWRWWRHSVFAPLALLVSGIRAVGCNFTSPRDRAVIWRVDILCVDEYRCVVSRGYYAFLRFLCVLFLCIASFTESFWFYVRFFVLCASKYVFVLFT